MKSTYAGMLFLVCLSVAGSAVADTPQQGWMSVYQDKATILRNDDYWGESFDVNLPAGMELEGQKQKRKKVHYQGTRSLLSSQLVQRLRGMGTPTNPGIIHTARMVAGISVAGSVLPDGSDLAGVFLQGWIASFVPDVSLYAITYRSQRVNGTPTILSGLVVVPEHASGTEDPDAVLVYMHATTTQENSAPSERSQEAYAVITAFSNPHAVLAMPDYLGYGVSKGNHPYAMGQLNAPAGRGMIIATRELMKKLRRTVGNKIYITGYSEGGGNALWLTRYLEEKGEASLQPTRSAPMSGPYDLSGATAQSFIGDQPFVTYQENFTSKPTLLSFSAVSTSRITHQPLTALLQEPLAKQARGQFPGKLSEANLGVRLLTTAVNDLAYFDLATGSPDPENLLQPGLVTAIRQHDLSNPAIRLWSKNDNLAWVPQSPVMLLGILQDELVPFAASSYPVPDAWKSRKPAPEQAPYAEGNAENLIAAMRAQGIGAQRVGWTAFNGAVHVIFPKVIMSHADGMLPCSILAQSYFFTPATAIPQLDDPLP